ncbi:MAG: right-handed parallel beta-helix repeat-containing protein [Kiritimatiellae bacterium]|nr:right-handed parallel beta-helix repeat-containing protein [Kiritimatiellia bacterium]
MPVFWNKRAWRRVTRAVVLTLLVFAAPAEGGTYYVAGPGSDENPGSAAAPFRTIQKAADTVRPGDTVLVRGGRYAESVVMKTSGAAGGVITFRPEPGTGPVLLANPAAQNTSKPVILIEDCSYIHVIGFVFKDYAFGPGIRIASTEYDHTHAPPTARGNVIRGNHFLNLGNPEREGSVDPIRLSYAGPGNLIVENTFSNVHGRAVTLNGFGNTVAENVIGDIQGRHVGWTERLVGCGIHFGGEYKLSYGGGMLKKYGDKAKETVPRTKGMENVVARNVITRAFGPCIWGDVNGDRHEIVGNVMSDSRTGVFIESRCDDNLVQENIVYNCRIGYATAAYGVGPARRNLWANNVAFGNNQGFCFFHSYDNLVVNNMGVENEAADVFVSTWTAQNGGNVFLNNLWFSRDRANLASYNSGLRAGKLVSFADWTRLSGERGGLCADPGFAAPAGGPAGFRLRPGSPAVKSGELGLDRGAYPVAHGAPADGPALSFRRHWSRSLEGEGPVELGLTLDRPSKSRVAARCVVLGGTGRATGPGADFRLQGERVVFEPGETEKRIRIEIADDQTVEDTETVLLGICDPANAVHGPHRFHVHTINDDDGGPEAPGQLMATSLSDTVVRLNWADNSASERAFSVRRRNKGETDWERVGSAGRDATSFVDTRVAPDTEYEYTVLATRGDVSFDRLDPAYSGAPSDIAAVRTLRPGESVYTQHKKDRFVYAGSPLEIEAEHGQLVKPMVESVDPGHGVVEHILVPVDAKQDKTNAKSGTAEFTIETATPMQCYVWGRVYAADQGTDSFWVSLDGGDRILWDIWDKEKSGQWHWEPVSERGKTRAGTTGHLKAPALFTLKPGRNVLQIRCREDGAKLDKLVIVDKETMFIPDDLDL